MLGQQLWTSYLCVQVLDNREAFGAAASLCYFLTKYIFFYSTYSFGLLRVLSLFSDVAILRYEEVPSPLPILYSPSEAIPS